MGNRSRFHARPNRGREYQRGHHDGVHHGMDDAIHLLLADLPDSGVTLTDNTFDCEGAECHGCVLERHGFTRLARTWINSDACERHS
jgi:hypothetical protein